MHQTWQQFSTTFWLNGTADTFWPDTQTAEHIGGSKCVVQGGYFSAYCVSYLLPFLESYYAYSYNNKEGFQLSSPDYLAPRILEGTPRVNRISSEAWSFAPHWVTLLVQTYLWFDRRWHPPDNKPTGSLSRQISSQAAAVRNVCSRDI